MVQVMHSYTMELTTSLNSQSSRYLANRVSNTVDRVRKENQYPGFLGSYLLWVFNVF